MVCTKVLKLTLLGIFLLSRPLIPAYIGIIIEDSMWKDVFGAGGGI